MVMNFTNNDYEPKDNGTWSSCKSRDDNERFITKEEDDHLVARLAKAMRNNEYCAPDNKRVKFIVG